MHSRPDSLLQEQRGVLCRVEELEGRKAQLYVEAADLRADLGRLWEDERSGFAEMELAGTAQVGQIRAARELADAQRLRDLFPQVRALAAEGLVYVPAVEAVLMATRRCSPEVQLVVDARMAAQMVGRNVTDVRRAVAHVVLAVEAEIDPELTREREDAARKDARVRVSPGQDGMTAIGAVIDAVAGRRWALDFDAIVRAQRTLDVREGRDRTRQEIEAEVFATLPSLVAALVAAARDGRLTELAEAAEIDPGAAADLSAHLDAIAAPDPADVARSASPDDAGPVASERGPAPLDPESDPFDTHAAVDATTGHLLDPFDADAVTDPFADVVWVPGEEPQEPEAPEPAPRAWAAQDAARGHDNGIPLHGSSTGASLQVLISRCLRMPLANPTVLNLHIPMATVIDLAEDPGLLEGHGPLGARRIRELLPSARLREVYVDEDSGVPLGAAEVEDPRAEQATLTDLLGRLQHVTLTDETQVQHDPSARLAGFVKLRDQVCDGIGCSLAASRCHLDHEREFPFGPTAEWNLKDRSPRCHGAKHHGWTPTRSLSDGSTSWLSPTGRSYTSAPVWQPPPKVYRPWGVTFFAPRTQVG